MISINLRVNEYLNEKTVFLAWFSGNSTFVTTHSRVFINIAPALTLQMIPEVQRMLRFFDNQGTSLLFFITNLQLLKNPATL